MQGASAVSLPHVLRNDAANGLTRCPGWTRRSARSKIVHPIGGTKGLYTLTNVAAFAGFVRPFFMSAVQLFDLLALK